MEPLGFGLRTRRISALMNADSGITAKSRIFCKHLSSFTGWEYVTRGKTSLSMFGDESFLLVGESRGNPGSFNFFSDGKCVLSIRANVSLDKDIEPGEAPTI